MRRRNKISTVFTGLGMATSLALLGSGCNDYTTGQDVEPEGALTITKLILFDNTRGASGTLISDGASAPVFTDTSAPSDCTNVPPDDITSDVGKACNGPFRDKYSVKKAPPTTNSGDLVPIPGVGETGGIYVVFNKLPLKIGAGDLEKVTKKENEPPTKLETDQSALKLECAGTCTGAPPGIVKAVVTGTELSADPDGTVNGIPIPFGPAIRWVIDNSMDPLVSLEPETAYKITVNSGLSGRDGNKVDLGAKAQMLLSFTIAEKFRVLAAGLNDGDDMYVYDEPGQAYDAGTVAADGALVLQLNAPVDDSIFKMGTVTATVDGKAVPVGITIAMDGMECDPGNGRFVYIFPDNDPDPAKRSWGSGKTISVTIVGDDIHDLAQDAKHTLGKGAHKLSGMIKIAAENSGMPADKDYAGTLAGDLFKGKCLK